MSIDISLDKIHKKINIIKEEPNKNNKFICSDLDRNKLLQTIVKKTVSERVNNMSGKDILNEIMSDSECSMREDVTNLATRHQSINYFQAVDTTSGDESEYFDSEEIVPQNNANNNCDKEIQQLCYLCKNVIMAENYNDQSAVVKLHICKSCIKKEARNILSENEDKFNKTIFVSNTSHNVEKNEILEIMQPATELLNSKGIKNVLELDKILNHRIRTEITNNYDERLDSFNNDQELIIDRLVLSNYILDEINKLLSLFNKLSDDKLILTNYDVSNMRMNEVANFNHTKETNLNSYNNVQIEDSNNLAIKSNETKLNCKTPLNQTISKPLNVTVDHTNNNTKELNVIYLNGITDFSEPSNIDQIINIKDPNMSRLSTEKCIQNSLKNCQTVTSSTITSTVSTVFFFVNCRKRKADLSFTKLFKNWKRKCFSSTSKRTFPKRIFSK